MQYCCLQFQQEVLQHLHRPFFFFEKSNKFKRVRPGDPLWPSHEKWEQLNKAVYGNLVKLESPLASCKTSAGNIACDDLCKNLKNPYYIGDNPALTQSSGWLDAWRSEPSVYAVAAKSTDDVVAAVNFARNNNLRLVVKGGGIVTRVLQILPIHYSYGRER